MMRATVTVLWLIATVASAAAAQQVRGTLRDVATGRPLPYGTLELVSDDGRVAGSAFTDERGMFTVSAQVPGRYRLRAFRTDTDTVVDGPVDLAASHVRELDFLIPVDATQLDSLGVPIDAAPPLLEQVGFLLREQSSLGTFLTRRDIEGDLQLGTSGVLARIPGVQVEYGVGRASAMLTLRAVDPARGRSMCHPSLYLDGVPARQPDGGGEGDATVQLDLGTIRPDDILGIEVYRTPAETPAPFAAHSSACGVIVIWTG